MREPIPIELAGTREIEIDGARIAAGFGLDVDAFRQLMDDRRITVLCERGTGDDAGLYRASFYHGTTRVRVVIDADGALLPDGFSVERMPAAKVRDVPPRATE